MRTTTDVLVVGGGPAGTAAAITLARAGRTVTVLDKATFPRDKCCGDGLTTLALRELEALDFTPAHVEDWQVVDGAVLRSPSGREVTVPLPAGAGAFAAVTPRRQLDAPSGVIDGGLPLLRVGRHEILVDRQHRHRETAAECGLFQPIDVFRRLAVHLPVQDLDPIEPEACRIRDHALHRVLGFLEVPVGIRRHRQVHAARRACRSRLGRRRRRPAKRSKG